MDWWVYLLIAIAVLAFIILIVVIWWIVTLNSFRKIEVKVDESESSIDISLTKRHDLLTKMIASVKGAIKYELETLIKITEIRQPAHKDSITDKQEFADQVTKGIQGLNVVLENYPNLKANDSIIKMQESVAEVEENLQASRRIYNSNVSSFNQKVVSFPSNIVAKKYQFFKKEFFEAEELKKEDVVVNF